jgi:hypothetical protein
MITYLHTRPQEANLNYRCAISGGSQLEAQSDLGRVQLLAIIGR